MIRILILALLLATTPAFAGDRPLEALAARVPADTRGVITLASPALARREAGRAIAQTTPADRDFAGFYALSITGALDTSLLGRFPDGGRPALGFSVFDITAVAAFGEPPSVALIAQLPGLDPETIDAALPSRGFSRAQRAGHPVWSRQDDNAVNPMERMSDPFAGQIGHASRFLVDGDALYFARAWPVLEHMIAPGAVLAGDRDIAAILDAGYAYAQAGSFIEATFLPGPVTRMLDPVLLEQGNATLVPPGFELPGLPPFNRFAILKWQDGARLTGAIAIPYVSHATAEQARDRFSALLGQAVSLAARRPFDEILPPERDFRVIETGGRAVLVLSFSLDISKGDDPPKPASMLRHPGNRLMSFHLNRELNQLIGTGEPMLPARTKGAGKARP